MKGTEPWKSFAFHSIPGVGRYPSLRRNRHKADPIVELARESSQRENEVMNASKAAILLFARVIQRNKNREAREMNTSASFAINQSLFHLTDYRLYGSNKYPRDLNTRFDI